MKITTALNVSPGSCTRTLLWRLKLGALLVSLVPALMFAGAQILSADAVPDAVTAKAQPFDLKDVRLLEGPFKRAMELDAAYLLRLEPDRLLHNFRKFAGLEPKGPIYGGWERMGVGGHTLGHYLSACSMMYSASGDARFRDRVNYIVSELALCQDEKGTGYVGGIPDADRVFSEVAAGDIRSKGFDLNGCWVPWYTLHKLFAGLLDANAHCGNDKAIQIAKHLADWAIKTTQNLNDEQWQRMLACEHGGMNEALASLYAVSGEAKYLDLAKKFYHKAVLDPLSERDDRLPGLHGNTQIPKIIGTARLYELTGQERYRTISEFFWDRVAHHHSYVIGGHSMNEHFGQPDKLSDRLGPATAETCNTYNMLKLTRHLFAWNPAADYIDFYERALYNHILASQDPESGMMCYYIPLNQGGAKTYSTPFDSFWCCVGTGIENHVKYGDTIYFHGDNALYVNLFIPSELRWKDKGITVRQETQFPQENTVQLTMACDEPVDLELRIRHPGWATGSLKLLVNGKPFPSNSQPGSFASIQRQWKSGDRVEIELPTRLRLESMPDNPKRIAILRGPIVLAGDLSATASDESRRQSEESPLLPVFVTESRPVEQWTKPVDEKLLVFKTAGVGRPQDVQLVPFYAMHNKPYSVYWDVFTDEEWKAKQAAYRAEQARLKALEAITIDRFRPGEMQPERDHNLQGEKTGAGDFSGRKWRHAVDGGWFSFEMKVPPDAPVDLVCTWWGSDSGGREFDILVDDTKIATQRLSNNKPGQFYDVTYPIPEDITRGKEKVTVKLQAHPGRTAGGIFGCRTIKRQIETDK